MDNSLIIITEALARTQELTYELRRQYISAPSDEIIIKAAKQAAKEYRVPCKEILKRITPSSNISGSNTWNKDGKIIKVK